MHARRSQSHHRPSRTSLEAHRRRTRGARRPARAVADRRGRGRRRRRAQAGRPAQRRRQPRAAAVRLARFEGRRQLRVPDRGRPRLQLLDPGSAQHAARHVEHTRDDHDRRPQRHVLVARAGGDGEGPGVGVVEGALGAQGVDGCAPASRSRQRRAGLLSVAAADAFVGARTARGEVPRLTRHRSGSGHADRRQDGRDVRDELRPVAHPVGRQGQDLLLGRDPARCTGQPRRAVEDRLVRLGVAVADRDEAHRRAGRARDVRPGVLVAACGRRRAVRARGELLA